MSFLAKKKINCQFFENCPFGWMMLTDYQQQHLLEGLNRVTEYHISAMFAAPVDPERDGCPNYLEIIKTPMDLGTVRKKLLNNEYETVQDCKNDVALIWDNTIKFNGPNSIISFLAKQLEKVFKDNTDWLSGDDYADWHRKCAEIKARNAATRVNFEKKAVSSKPSRQHSQAVEAPAPAAAPPSHPPKPRGRPAKRKAEPEHPPVVAEVVTVIEEVKDEQPAPPPPPPPKEEVHIGLDQEEKDQLAQDIQEISDKENADDIQRLIDFIASQEPNLVKDGVVDTDLNLMKPETHLGLRKLADEILKSYHSNV